MNKDNQEISPEDFEPQAPKTPEELAQMQAAHAVMEKHAEYCAARDAAGDAAATTQETLNALISALAQAKTIDDVRKTALSLKPSPAPTKTEKKN